MELIKNKTYLLVFNVGNKILSFTGKIIIAESGFIKFKDKFGETITYSKRYLVSFKEIENE